MIPEIKLATNTANVQSNHLCGSWAISKITAAIADGPASIGTARGTTKGSDSSSWLNIGLVPGKIILMAIMNNMIPPAIPSDDCAIWRSWSRNLPTNIKNIKIKNAIINSLMMIIFRLSIGIFLRILKNTGTFPIGSIIITSNKIEANTVT